MKKYLLLLCIPAFTACETVVEVDIPLTEPTIVMNALMEPDSVFTATATLSKHILESEDITFLVENPTILVVDDESGETIDELIFAVQDRGPLHFRGTQRPVPGKRYSFQLQSPRNGWAAATETVPMSVEISSIEIDSSGLSSPDGRIRMDISFQDRPGERNFYSLSLHIESFYLSNGDTIRYSYPSYLEPADPELEQDYYYGSELLVDDLFFDGKERTLRVKLPYYYQQPQFPVKMYFVLSHLSESYYKYLSTLYLQQSVSGDPFAQPVQVFSNIENGLGILGARSKSIYALKE